MEYSHWYMYTTMYVRLHISYIMMKHHSHNIYMVPSPLFVTYTYKCIIHVHVQLVAFSPSTLTGHTCTCRPS